MRLCYYFYCMLRDIMSHPVIIISRYILMSRKCPWGHRGNPLWTLQSVTKLTIIKQGGVIFLISLLSRVMSQTLQHAWRLLLLSQNQVFSVVSIEKGIFSQRCTSDTLRNSVLGHMATSLSARQRSVLALVGVRYPMLLRPYFFLRSRGESL